ncbi:Calmodulin [Thelohanellus kitauei]|uniref:Calmodulin n=1 Tax=Thelohanellus kitauei TaxID=669202 RepID=A0A0C2M1L5_THEKT|nr:Calmodulin [Thelohanellus kitauei]
MSGELKEAFNHNDHNGNGRITFTELDSALRCLGKMHTATELKDLVKDMGKSETDLFNMDDFRSLCDNIRRDIFNSKNVVLDAFKTFDKNEDGFVSVAEIRHILTTMGEKLSDEEAKDFIKDADPEGNGRIQYAQFCNSLTESVH